MPREDHRENLIKAYRYRRQVAELISWGEYRLSEKIEYFIPERLLVLNNLGKEGASEPFKNVGLLENDTATPLTKVAIPEDYLTLADTPGSEEYASIFEKKYVHEKLNEECSILIPLNCVNKEKHFDEAYQLYGNDVLLVYILNYIQNNQAHHKETIEKIFVKIDQLDELEKQSLLKSLQAKLASNQSKISKPEPQIAFMLTTLFSTGAILTAFYHFTENVPLTLMGGLINAGVRFFDRKLLAYQQQCQELKEEILKALNPSYHPHVIIRNTSVI